MNVRDESRKDSGFILAVDFGSTFTKVVAISTEKPEILGTAKSPTTIGTDIRGGLNNAVKELTAQTGKLTFTHKLAASSAYGGLKMVAVGLVPSLTAKAANLAACSAGAKVVKTFSYELNASEQEEIHGIQPDLILLSGGTDGGNKDVILHNAKKLAEIESDFAVIIAGNKSAAEDAREVLTRSGKHAVICGNVMPVFNTLDTLPARDAINALFLEKIIKAKGLAQAAREMTMPIIPTPLAVFECMQLLSENLGDILAVDVGGATTDVYSMCRGAPTLPGVTQKGLPEPFAKRTVEGDLGMRHSQETLIDKITSSQFETKLPDIESYRTACRSDYAYIPPAGSPHAHFDQMLAGTAVDIATTRHAGYLETAYTPFGESFYQMGKDLTAVKYVVGIGGPIIYTDDPASILQNAATPTRHATTPTRDNVLKPASPKFIWDKKYIFSAMGLLARVDKQLALRILESEL
ncbi:MAG: methylaspartate mutase accessory protein GlmL [Defluviitaleaceae bacterium]|nr:methylaspartate mutase accessory protein GlmL [Defluviitaleaceae bacterium]